MKTKVKITIVGAVISIAIVCTVAVYLITRAPAGPGGPSGKPPSLEMPLEEITDALAAREGVPTDNVEIQFCTLSSETDNNHFAVGAIVIDKSIVFFFDNSTAQITVENNYTSSGNELQAVTILKKQLSKWTGNKIVPGWFQSVAGGYTFRYYDGYSARFQRWLWGFGTVNLENRSVEWGAHSV